MKTLSITLLLLTMSSIAMASQLQKISGIGVVIEKAAYVVWAKDFIENSPAQAELKKGDLIIRVKHDSNSEWVSTSELSLDDVVKLIRGPVGVEVGLAVFRPSIETVFEFSIKRQEFNVDDGNDLESVTKEAQLGDSNSQNKLGEYYLFGRFVPQNFDKAMHWFLKASRQGHAEAPNHIGRLYLNGEGAARDPKEACKWYELSSKRGDSAERSNAKWCRENGYSG